jgi:hypothetical protein
MAERFKIVIQPSDLHPGILSVQDAMRQVYDVFDYLAVDSKEIVWKLVYASTNSPLTVEAEAISYDPQIDVTVIARAQKARTAKEVHAMLKGDEPSELSGTERLKVAERIFRRNTNGIGRTSIILNDARPPLVIEKGGAEVAIAAIEAHHIRANREHVEVGSIEGRLVSVETHYNKPAIHIKERSSGDGVRCVVTIGTARQIANDVNFEDVWSGRRVMVRGKIRYDKDGRIVQVDANQVERIFPRTDLTLSNLYDPDFTNGLDSDTYLERLREGELG